MKEISEEKPTKEYYYSLCSKAAAMTAEAMDVLSGKVKLSREERDAWNKKKDDLHAEIKRVRRLL